MNAFKKCLEVLRYILGTIGVILVVALTVLTFIGVIGRFCHHTITWQYELSLVMFSWICFSGAMLAFKNNDHVQLTFIDDMLPAKGSYILRQFLNLICLAFLVIAVKEGFEIVKTTGALKYQTIAIPKSLFYMSFPVSAVYGALQVFYNMLSLNVDTIRAEKEAQK